MAGMDDREDPEDLITMEAMSGLAKVFEKIEESCVRPILINISLRIRPCFEKVHGEGCWEYTRMATGASCSMGHLVHRVDSVRFMGHLAHRVGV